MIHPDRTTGTTDELPEGSHVPPDLAAAEAGVVAATEAFTTSRTAIVTAAEGLVDAFQRIAEAGAEHPLLRSRALTAVALAEARLQDIKRVL